jgi:hypothetical protein
VRGGDGRVEGALLVRRVGAALLDDHLRMLQVHDPPHGDARRRGHAAQQASRRRVARREG